MKRMLAVLIMLALPLAAQEKKTEEAQQSGAPRSQKLFILKYADLDQVARALSVFSGTTTRAISEIHALAVDAPLSTMSGVEDVIRRLDISASAPQNLELVAYFLVARSEEGQGLISDSAPEPPKELESTVNQLRSAFAFKSYRLLETMSLRTRSGQRASASSSGAARTIRGSSVPIVTQLNINSASVEADGRIRITGLKVGQRVPYLGGTPPPNPTPTSNPSISYSELGFSTDVDLKDGQKVVIGRNALNPREAIFLVLTARVVQ
jgi:hypothetical protein